MSNHHFHWSAGLSQSFFRISDNQSCMSAHVLHVGQTYPSLILLGRAARRARSQGPTLPGASLQASLLRPKAPSMCVCMYIYIYMRIHRLYHPMLCCVALPCVMLCYAMLCYAMLCYAMLCYAMLCYAMLCYAMLCYAMLCYAMLC